MLVATVLTACGIETWLFWNTPFLNSATLQQCLPLAVLKLTKVIEPCKVNKSIVATVLTACGIETRIFAIS